MNLQGIKGDVDRLIEQKKLVARIKLRGVTPWWGGDYSTNTSDHVDEDEVAGRVRWFLRTVYNRFCANDLSSYNEAEDYVSRYLGSTTSKSQYTFRVRDEAPSSDRKDYSRLSRVRLVAKKDPKREPRDIASLTLEIYRNSGDRSYDDVLVGSTLITLAFLSVGRGANRGFGRFIPTECDSSNLNNLCKSIENGEVREAFNEFYEIFKKKTCSSGATVSKSNDWRNSSVPLAPITDMDKPDGIKEVNCVNADLISVMKKIEESVTRKTLKSHLSRQNTPGGYTGYTFIHSWIYGLPRQNRYFETQKKNVVKEPRRQSMFVISPVKTNRGYKVFVLPFLSLKDHEKEVYVYKLIYKDRKGNQTQVSSEVSNLQGLIEKYSELLNDVLKCLLCGQSANRTQHGYSGGVAL